MKQNVFVTEWLVSGGLQFIIVKDLNGRVIGMFTTLSDYCDWCEEKLTLETE